MLPNGDGPVEGTHFHFEYMLPFFRSAHSLHNQKWKYVAPK